MSLDEAIDSESALSVSDCLEDISILSDEDGVRSLGGLTGLEVFELRRGEDVTLNFLKGSVFVLYRERALILFGELSCKLAFLCRGILLRRFG